jgi:hypothetical protein
MLGLLAVGIMMQPVPIWSGRGSSKNPSTPSPIPTAGSMSASSSLRRRSACMWTAPRSLTWRLKSRAADLKSTSVLVAEHASNKDHGEK